ncbi:MAG: cold-shock protein [Rhodococcus sp.]|nr:cold-shock protein [Rhodococcus sp. (in: high G+C Gram-positive bacteria)]
MPHRRPKPSLILGAVAAVAVAGPLAVHGLSGTSSPDVQSTSSDNVVSTDIAKVALSQVPDIVIPVKELTGLNLPDVNLGILRSIPLPDSITLPPGVELPGGLTLDDLSIPIREFAANAAASAAADETAGAVVKEVSRDEPFSMVALTSDTVSSALSRVRAQGDDGSWGPWITLDAIDGVNTDGTLDDGTTATEPVFVGVTRAIQIMTPALTPGEAAVSVPSDSGETGEGAAAPAPEPAPEPEPEAAPEAELGYEPASVNRPLRTQEPTLAGAEDVTAVLIDPGTGPADSELADIATPVSGSVGGPRVITRSQWGADESIRCGNTTYDDALGGATVHHTAGSNDYSPAESAGIVRAIYAYHAQTLGWCDIGYNVMVDRYGQIFEGRAGGLDRPVQGAHAGGFNENTVGIAMMGDFSFQTPPQTTIDSVGQFLGWRLGIAGLDPLGHTTMYSEGTPFTPYPLGAAVNLPIIFAHRDVGSTACPGDGGYAQMNQIRQIAAANVGGAALATSSSTPNAPRNPAVPRSDAAIVPGEHLPALVNEILRLTDNSPFAQKWVAEGGEAGRLGDALTGILPASNGYNGVHFVNGAIYSSPNGGTWTVLGEIFRMWRELGGDVGELGLPTSDEYPVPNGMRSDFEHGSLIFNEITGAVTTILKAYNDTYEQHINDAAAPAPEVAPAPEEVPAG